MEGRVNTAVSSFPSTMEDLQTDDEMEESSSDHDVLRMPHNNYHEPQVLQPDNPLMIRFQAALKAHLTRQSNKLEEEIIGLVGVVLCILFVLVLQKTIGKGNAMAYLNLNNTIHKQKSFVKYYFSR